MIAAKSSLMRNSLWSFLRATLPNQAVVFANQFESALRMVTEEKPVLAIVDADLADSGMQNLIRWIRTEEPSVRLVALVESRREQQSCIALGANHALLKGFLDEELRNAVMDTMKEHKGV